MKKIDFENHFVTSGWVEALSANSAYPRMVIDEDTGQRRLYYQEDAFEPYGDHLLQRLLDLGEGRIREMDAAGVDCAILSLTSPGCDQLDPAIGCEVAASTNDVLAAAIGRYPQRFAGLAALCPHDVDAAVRELDRAVNELGLGGWKTHSNFGDSYIDEERYWPILAKAEELHVPIYLHPASPRTPELRTYGLALAGAAFGFGIETATSMVRLVLSGAFDRYPGLQVILGHYGEGLPFLMQRIDHAFVRPHVVADSAAVPPLAHFPSHYLRRNMCVSTSGNYLPAAFACTREALGIDAMLLGTDYPYEEMDECTEFLAAMPMTPDEQSRLYSMNAARLGFVA